MMKLNDEFDNKKKSRSPVLAAFFAVTFILLVVLTVILFNSDALKRKFGTKSATSINVSSVKEMSTVSQTTPSVSISEGITVSDLDFYDMYPVTVSEDTGEIIETSTQEPEESIETDGKHTKVILEDQTEEWVAISPNIPKSSYDYTNLLNQAGKYKYFEQDKCISFFGVDISKEQNYIDFNKLKKAGVDFVMIRMGARGYQSGQLTTDDYFTDNLKRASDAGLEVGVYFISEAVSAEEAVEEVNYITEAIGDYKLTYPVAMVMQSQKNDVSRIDGLTKSERTAIVRAFLSAVKDAGLKPVLYGDKLWLMKYYDLVKIISDYDIWYTGTDDDGLPDFPYRFSMWQYNRAGTIDGIVGTVNFDISFTDYSLK